MYKTILCALLTVLLIPVLVEARITKIQITIRDTAFGGYSWPGVGQYERIVGTAYAEVDPNDPRNAVIVDLGLAQIQASPGAPGKNANGKVEYSFNFYILKPINLGLLNPGLNGFGKVMYEPPNRGNKTWTVLGRVTGGGNDPASITDATVLANSFLMPRGYTLVWSGWEPSGSLASLTAAAALPIAKDSDGSSITGPAYEYIVTGANSFTLAYPAANASDTATARLTHRVHLNDAPQTIPVFGSTSCVSPATTCWEYTSSAGTAIRLVTPAHVIMSFVANDIYEFAYIAKDPVVAGLGFAAVRDWNSWLKYETEDDLHTPNPLANYVTRIYTEVLSQPGRLLNDFRHLGFNEDEKGRKVFDGHMQWIAAGDGINMNYRFSQSGRTERNRQEHLYPEGVFPFANVTTFDPITHKMESRYTQCEATQTCPLGVEIYSANEYWVKAASLLHTTPDGTQDLPDSPYARNYFMSSMQHGTGSATTRGICQQFQNPLNSAPVQRALFLALDKWSTKGIPAPDSRVPKLSDGTLQPPLPQSAMGFPTIPDPFGETPDGKVTYTGLKTTRYLFDYGPGYYDGGPAGGIPTINPPVFPFTNPSYQDDPGNGPIYPSFIPKTDIDGNDIAGVRLPDITVPLSTYTGWGLRRGAQANDGCEAAGQFIPFPRTSADRQNSGDPRLSVAERYPSFEAYDNLVIATINSMIQDRLMLCEDAPNELQRLRQAGVDRGVPQPPGSFTPYSFPLASISSVTASPNILWPPNGEMVAVLVAVSVADNCNVTCRIVQVSGNDGATAADWQISGPLTVNLRSERSGKAREGRAYTLTLECVDDAGMTSTKTINITVPHDQGKD